MTDTVTDDPSTQPSPQHQQRLLLKYKRFQVIFSSHGYPPPHTHHTHTPHTHTPHTHTHTHTLHTHTHTHHTHYTHVPHRDDVCVVPIEDEVLSTDNVCPAPEQPPTTVTMETHKPSGGQVKLLEVNLPGTPVNDHTVISLDAADSSHCGSSVSSDASVKSSDMLLPVAAKH